MLPLFIKRCSTLYSWNIDMISEEAAESTNKMLQTLWRGMCNFLGNCNYQVSIVLDAKIIGGHIFNLHNIDTKKDKSVFNKLVNDTIKQLNESGLSSKLMKYFKFLKNFKKNDIIPDYYFNDCAEGFAFFCKIYIFIFYSFVLFFFG